MSMELYYNQTPSDMQSLFQIADDMAENMLFPGILVALFLIIFINAVMAGYDTMKSALSALFIMNIVGYLFVAFEVLKMGWMVIPTVAMIGVALFVMLDKRG